MKIFLHIGTHKTGSTLIQKTCALNHTKLKSSGVFYPVDYFSQWGHHELAWKMMQGRIQEARKWLHDIINEAKASDCKSLIISSEEFEFANNFVNVKKLFGDLDVELIVYLRRQDKYLESEYNQHVKMYDVRFKGDIFQFFMYHDFNFRFNYKRLIGSWVKNLDLINYNVVSYDEVAKNDSLLESFLRTVLKTGRDSLDLKCIDSKDNVSIPSDLLIYLSRLNREEGVTKEKHIEFMKKLLEKSDEKAVKKRFLTSDYSERLVSKYKVSNLEVEKKYMESPLFSYSYNESPVVDFYRDFNENFYASLIEDIF